MDKEHIPNPSGTEINDLLRSTKLLAFAGAMAEYGFETLDDLNHFNDTELQHEFMMSASEIQRLRAGAAAQANRRTVATPPPPSVQLQQQPAAQRGMQASVSNIQMASAWGMADEEMELAALMAKSSSLTPDEVARAQELMRQQKHTYAGKPVPPPPPEFKARVLLEETRAKASAAAARGSALAATTTAAAARSARAAAARGSAAAESYVLGPGQQQRRWSLNAYTSEAERGGTVLNAAPPTNLKAFLEVHGLGHFATAMGVFGVTSLSDLADGSPFHDDDTCRDIGMDSMQLRTFRDAIRRIPALPLVQPPTRKAEVPSEEVATELGDDYFGAYAYDDSGIAPRRQHALKSTAAGAAKATKPAIIMSATCGGSKTAPPQRGAQSSKHWLPGNDEDDDSDEDVDFRTAFRSLAASAPHHSASTSYTESASTACQPTGMTMTSSADTNSLRMATKPSYPTSSGLYSSSAAPSFNAPFEEVAPSPMLNVPMKLESWPEYSSVDVPESPAVFQQSVASFPAEISPANEPPSEVPTLPPAPLDPRIKALPESERPKVEQQVAAVLAECHLPSQGEMVDLSPEYSKTASSNKPWLTHAVAHLTGGVAAATSDRGVHALQSLGVYRATNKCLEELHMCDAERKVQLPFPDNQLVSHEPNLLRFHQDFTLTPLQRVAESCYPEVLQGLLAVRAKAKRARAAIGTLQADIASQREAGDLDSALLSQERLVSSFRESINFAHSSRTTIFDVRASLYSLAQALASAGSPDGDMLLTSEAEFWREIETGGKESQAVSFYQHRLHQSASDLRAQLEEGKHRCQCALDFVASRANELERERREGPLLNLDDGSKDPITKDSFSALSSSSSDDGWTARAHDVVKEQEAKAQEDEASRAANFEKLMEEQRIALETAIASGDQASYLRVQSQQLRTKADHWATEQANIAKWRQSAIEEAKIMDQNYAALIQARHTRQVGLELASEALKAKKEALEATLEVYTTTNVLLEAMEARASWLREVFGARFHWLNQVLSEVDLEGLEDYLSVAREQLKWVQTLCNRKARDLSHLSSRLEQHTQERLNALERDNADDVRRADRNYTEATTAQQRAVASLDAAKEQRKEALGELVACLRSAAQTQPLPPHLVAMAKEASSLAQQELSSSLLPPQPDVQAELAAMTFHESNEFGTSTESSSSNTHSNETALEARFAVVPSIEEVELLCEVLGCLARGGLPEDFMSSNAPASAAPPAGTSQLQLHQHYEQLATSATAATAAAAVGSPGAPQEVHVQLFVPVDSSVGSYLDASVCHQGVDIPFRVVVPEDAVPGVTWLTVPVPVNNPPMTSAVPESFDTAPPPPSPAPPPQPHAGSHSEVDAAAAARLVEIGFSYDDAVRALIVNHGQEDLALNQLLH